MARTKTPNPTTATNTKATASGSASSRLGFTGELMGAADGTVYLRARHYNPVLGRFLQREAHVRAADVAQQARIVARCHGRQSSQRPGHEQCRNAQGCPVARACATVARPQHPTLTKKC